MLLNPSPARAYEYIVTEKPEAGAVTIETLKAHLKLRSCSQDMMLQLYLDSAITYAEEFMGIDLITRTYVSYRDFFPLIQNESFYALGTIPETYNQPPSNTGFVLRRTPFQSLEKIEYINRIDGQLVEVSNDVFLATQAPAGLFSNIVNKPEQHWPRDLVSPQLQSIVITFKTGFGDSESDIPADIKVGILDHASKMFFERGDCGCSADSVPGSSKMIYSKHRVVRL